MFPRKYIRNNVPNGPLADEVVLLLLLLFSGANLISTLTGRSAGQYFGNAFSWISISVDILWQGVLVSMGFHRAVLWLCGGFIFYFFPSVDSVLLIWSSAGPQHTFGTIPHSLNSVLLCWKMGSGEAVIFLVAKQSCAPFLSRDRRWFSFQRRQLFFPSWCCNFQTLSCFTLFSKLLCESSFVL